MHVSTPVTMPPEWAPHQCCWMAWPCNEALWGEALGQARAVYAQVARAIREFEPVRMLVRPEHAAQARDFVGGDIPLLPVALDDSWLRDSGPTFVRAGSGGLEGVCWRFNGWGKYPCERDRLVAGQLLQSLGVPARQVPLVCEGGAIHVDGEGTLLTTEAVLLNANRNPGLGREAVERQLMAALGVRKVIWLRAGLVDDDTDGHVDELACFVRPGVVLALTCRDPQDANYAVLQENLERLRRARDASGRALEVVEVEQPAADYAGGRRLSCSYVNFYLPNGGVVMPAFGDRRRDAQARELLGRLFPSRRVVQLPTRTLSLGGGNIHCITQQQPEA